MAIESPRRIDGGAMGALVIESLRRDYGGVAAVDGVTFRIDAGSVVGLVGPNGAGKTTLVNMISGVDAPSDGRIFFGGVDIAGWRPERLHRLGIARTFQNIRLFLRMSVYDNVAITAASSSRRRWRGEATEPMRAAVTECLSLVGLADSADRKASELAHADRKRLEVARALASRPRLLLLDEPTAGMSEAEASGLANLIRDLATPRRSVLIVSHEMSFVRAVCDQIILLNFGSVLAQGSPGVVLSSSEAREAYLGPADDGEGN